MPNQLPDERNSETLQKAGIGSPESKAHHASHENGGAPVLRPRFGPRQGACGCKPCARHQRLGSVHWAACDAAIGLQSTTRNEGVG